MKKFCFFAVICLCLLSAACLTGCSKEEDQLFYDIMVEKDALYDVAGANPDVYTSCLGMQFYEEEPVQIWAVYDGESSMDAYLYRMDGSRELLMKGVSDNYARGGGYVDQERNYYYWATNKGNFVKVDASGETLFAIPLSELGIDQIKQLCQLGDGRLYMVCRESSDALRDKLCRVDPSTGEITETENDPFKNIIEDFYIGAGEDCLLCMTASVVWKVDADKDIREEVWSFMGTTYSGARNNDYPVWNFRIREDGSLELLEGRNEIMAKGTDGVARTLRKIAIGEDRKVIVLRGQYLFEWIKSRVRRFNEESDEWYIILEECDESLQSWEDYARQTSMEIAAGKGPDLLFGNVLMDYEYGVFEKGGFADLGPYLESSGLKREDFFPCTFGLWQDGEKIYSASVNLAFWDRGGSILMDAEVLGGSREPDIGTLVDALLSWQENAVFMKELDSAGVLRVLLEGSESLWGMVDWEKGACDFDTELFAGILEVARRYGATGENDAPPLAKEEIYHIYEFRDRAVLDELGLVRVGYLFDDGCRPKATNYRTVMINENSRRKEGAWEFIRFLLEDAQPTGEDAQEYLYPASKKYFDSKMKAELEKKREGYRWQYEGVEGTYYSLTNERIQEIKEGLEEARYIPARPQPILNIIYEEAQGYFSGGKTLEDTIAVINNRAQVYLDEVGAKKSADGQV